MDWLFIIVNELRHIFAVLIAEFLLVLPAMEKRDRFALRISLCAVFLLYNKSCLRDFLCVYAQPHDCYIYYLVHAYRNMYGSRIGSLF